MSDAMFLREAARYFRNRDTHGEDWAHWANVYNAENCERIAERLEAWDEERPVRDQQQQFRENGPQVSSEGN